MNQLQILMLVLFRGINWNKNAAMKDMFTNTYMFVGFFFRFKDVKILLTSCQFVLTFKIMCWMQREESE